VSAEAVIAARDRGGVLLTSSASGSSVIKRVQRRLAAILAADVAGYSRLTALDEEGTHAQLQGHLRALVDPKIVEHRGRIVKNTGDGLLAEFSSVVDALRCALDIQGDMSKRNANVPQHKRLEFRIGINVGDIIIDRDDIFGEGVNVAARLEGLAEPGGICVSEDAHRQVRGKLEFSSEDIGEQKLKNITEPVRAYRLRSDGAAAIERPNLPLPDKPSIAVLPFQNMSADPEQEYFADGIVEEIITALSRFQHLFVIARNSSFTYKHRAVDAKQVGRELGVRYILEGSVRKAANHVRITGQLIDALTGAHLWADRSDGTLENIFDLQDRVTESVVGAITPKLEQAEIERAKRKPTDRLDAYDYYLRGISVVYGMTREANEEALRLFTKALELDPDFALAYARAAHCYTFRRVNRWMLDPRREVVEATRLARRAVDLGKDEALALSFGGLLLAYFGYLDDGVAFVRRAVNLNPNFATAWAFDGWMKLCFGEHSAAIEHVARAIRLSPLDPHLWEWQFFAALAHFFEGRYDEAASSVEGALTEQPNQSWRAAYRYRQ
jgi:TolB-like protein